MSLGGVLALLILEAVCFFLPVNKGIGNEPLSRFSPITGGEPGRTFSFSRDWNFTLFNNGKINADGFHATGNYPISGSDKVSVVIGDSFIEALMVPYGKTIQGQLGKALHNDENAVPGLGVSDADLGTYAYFVEKSAETWNLANIIIVLSENDIINAFHLKPGRSCYIEEDGVVSLHLPSYKTNSSPSAPKDLLKKVNLLNYIVAQLKLWPSNFINQFKSNELKRLKKTKYVDRSENKEQTLIALDQFFLKLQNIAQSSNCKTTLVLSRKGEDSFASKKNLPLTRWLAYINEEAPKRGIAVLDTYPLLHQMATSTGNRPFWMNDGHWTPEAHIVIGAALENIVIKENDKK